MVLASKPGAYPVGLNLSDRNGRSVEERIMMEEIQRKMIDIFRAGLSLELSDAEIQSLTRSDCPRWDSMGHLNLLLAIEDVFQISIPDEKGAAVASYGGMVQLVEGLKNGS